MSVVEFENPVVTVLRLIESRLRVVKDDGGLARVLCSQANYDRELLKDIDAQITVSKTADPCQQQKHTLDGKLRRRIYSLRATIIAVDKPVPSSDVGRVMRDKVLEQLLLIVPENRNLPYRTFYNFYPLDATSATHKAYDAAATSEPEPSNPVWTELSNPEYANLWGSDDLRHSKSTSGNGEFALMLFRFKIGIKAGEARNEPRKQCLKRLILAFEGFGVSPVGSGVTLKVWNQATSSWGDIQVGTAGTDETITVTLTANLPNYVDADGFLYLLARTTSPSDGSTPAVLHCDFVQATVDVRGITFCDVHSYRDVDVIDVKPFLYKEEIIIVAWLFESIAIS
ncbi:hypothetical protein G4O51_03110 [Candidatus Bathyarchaeota archaeon A05DMB-2]|nr:hypothetical protein [Candidatus Bathyarchaeota archaeon A05DMB-2]